MLFSVAVLCMVGAAFAAECTPEASAIGHTICLGQSVKLDRSLSGLSPAEEAAVLDLHNNYRSITAGEDAAGNKMYPTDLMKLKWNPLLAETAQKWADQCISGHEPHPKLRSEPTLPDATVGQNIAMRSGISRNFEALVGGWFKEEDDFVWAFNNSKVVGHWTMLSHNKMTSVGCGLAACPSMYWKTKLVCNYDNINRKSTYFEPYTASPYSSGRGSACKQSEREHGLCAGKCMSLNCRNGGAIDLGTCTCACQPGYKGASCETKDCNGLHNKHRGCDYWYETMWTQLIYAGFFKKECQLYWCNDPATN